jgi:DNA-binding CsgD family transcriptional regulator
MSSDHTTDHYAPISYYDEELTIWSAVSALRWLPFQGMNDSNPSLGVARALWNDLVSGSLQLQSPEPGSDGQLLRLSPAAPKPWTESRARRHAACAAVLRGQAQKVVAADLGLAPATLAGLVKAALFDLGIDVRCARVPVALPLLLHAAEGSRVVSLCEVGEGWRAAQHWQLSLGFPDQALAGALSAAEGAVTKAYLAGQSYREIARSRRSSARTVANQLGQSFRKLGASGRFSLLAAVVELGSRRHVPLTLTLRATPPPGEETAPRSISAFPSRALSA